MSWPRKLLLVLAAFLLMSSVAWYWLLHSDSGARFVWSYAQQRLPGQLTAASMDGDLSGGLRLEFVRYHTDALRIEAAETRVALNVDLLPLSVELTTLDIRTVSVELTSGDDDSADADIAELLMAMRLPMRILVGLRLG